MKFFSLSLFSQKVCVGGRWPTALMLAFFGIKRIFHQLCLQHRTAGDGFSAESSLMCVCLANSWRAPANRT